MELLNIEEFKKEYQKQKSNIQRAYNNLHTIRNNATKQIAKKLSLEGKFLEVYDTEKQTYTYLQVRETQIIDDNIAPTVIIYGPGFYSVVKHPVSTIKNISYCIWDFNLETSFSINKDSFKKLRELTKKEYSEKFKEFIDNIYKLQSEILLGYIWMSMIYGLILKILKKYILRQIVGLRHKD